jgi:hypothetical protein
MISTHQVSSSFDYVSGGVVCDGWYDPWPLNDDACVLHCSLSRTVFRQSLVSPSPVPDCLSLGTLLSGPTLRSSRRLSATSTLAAPLPPSLSSLRVFFTPSHALPATMLQVRRVAHAHLSSSCSSSSTTAPPTTTSLSDAPPHILAIASSYGPKFFLATFDVNTSVLTPLASFPNTTDV